jgi:hypothetical protein
MEEAVLDGGRRVMVAGRVEPVSSMTVSMGAYRDIPFQFELHATWIGDAG